MKNSINIKKVLFVALMSVCFVAPGVEIQARKMTGCELLLRKAIEEYKLKLEDKQLTREKRIDAFCNINLLHEKLSNYSLKNIKDKNVQTEISNECKDNILFNKTNVEFIRSTNDKFNEKKKNDFIDKGLDYAKELIEFLRKLPSSEYVSKRLTMVETLKDSMEEVDTKYLINSLELEKFV